MGRERRCSGDGQEEYVCCVVGLCQERPATQGTKSITEQTGCLFRKGICPLEPANITSLLYYHTVCVCMCVFVCLP